MSIVLELNKKTETSFPEGKIVLLDGRVIDCYPLATDETDSVSPEGLDIDRTGECTKTDDRREPASAYDKKMEKDLFIKNAFYFLANQERILTDSRMFLCPVPIQNGLAYFGSFKRPTLGVYLQWWESCAGAMRCDKKGRRSLVYGLSGSPLSGANHCAEVYEDGSTKSVTLLPFKDHYVPFIKINDMYSEAKQKYQSYTLQQVLDILDHENDDNKLRISCSN